MLPHPIDIHVGKKLRSKRIMLGLSQGDVGDSVGITFQQIQKYERGLNRIGASRLYDFSRFLGVDISYFYYGFDKDEDSSNSFSDIESLFEHESNNKEIMAMVKTYQKIEDKNIRKKILSLVKAISLSANSKKEKNDKVDKGLELEMQDL